MGEATRAFREFLRSRRVEFEIPVAKRRREVLRKVVIPSELLPRLYTCTPLLEIPESLLVNRVKSYCQIIHRFNTHSLRYAFITYLLSMGVNPAIIAKITNHARLDYIPTYTRKKAEQVLKNLLSREKGKLER